MGVFELRRVLSLGDALDVAPPRTRRPSRGRLAMPTRMAAITTALLLLVSACVGQSGESLGTRGTSQEPTQTEGERTTTPQSQGESSLPPSRERDALTDSPDLQFMVTCLTDAGFEAQAYQDGDVNVIKAAVPPAQQEQYVEAREACRLRAIDLGLIRPIGAPTEADLTQRYRAYTEIVQPCLVAHGYPTVEPPSLDSFIDAEGKNWHPYDAIPYATLIAPLPDEPLNPRLAAELAARRELRETCPADLTTLLPQLGEESG